MKIDETLEEAIEKLKAGEQEGFQVLYDQTHNYVFMQARTMLKNEADANDLVQEVYINAYNSIHTLQENQKIYAWLGSIAFNQGTKLLRKNKEVLLGGEDDTTFDNIISLDMDVQPEGALDKKASAEIISELIDELPELQKAALLAYYYDEMSVGQIAQAFDCSEGTIKSRLNYARKSLKDAVSEREKRDGIKLYSLSVPMLVLIFHLWANDKTMGHRAAESVYQGIQRNLKIAEVASGDSRSKLGGEQMHNTNGTGKMARTIQIAGKTIQVKNLLIGAALVVACAGTVTGIVLYQNAQHRQAEEREREAQEAMNKQVEELMTETEVPEIATEYQVTTEIDIPASQNTEMTVTTEAPTTPETPTVEPPTVETPTVEAPTVETPTVDTPAPTVETPTVETPQVSEPTVEAPTAETPTVEAPQVDEPEVSDDDITLDSPDISVE